MTSEELPCTFLELRAPYFTQVTLITRGQPWPTSSAIAIYSYTTAKTVKPLPLPICNYSSDHVLLNLNIPYLNVAFASE